MNAWNWRIGILESLKKNKNKKHREELGGIWNVELGGIGIGV
jgi:hypothetical protein